MLEQIKTILSEGWWSGLGVISTVIIPLLSVGCTLLLKKYKAEKTRNDNLRFAFDNYDLLKKYEQRSKILSSNLKSIVIVIEKTGALDGEDKSQARSILIELKEHFSIILTKSELSLIDSLLKEIHYTEPQNLNDFCFLLDSLATKITTERRYAHDIVE